MKPTCRHCRSMLASRPRGLCSRCYYTPGVRELFPSESPYGRRGVAVAADGQVEAETVEAPKSAKPRGRNWQPQGGRGPGAKPSKLDRLKGESYRHPSGYVPLYEGESDLPAFNAGGTAFGRGVRLSANPYETRRERESWTDGWLFAGSQAWWFNLPERSKSNGKVRGNYRSAFKRTRTGEHAA